MPESWVPDRGDLVKLDFEPQAGHEQNGRRPALVLSPKSYNRTSGLAIVCPITNQSKGYPFEISVDDEAPVTGVILSDQVKSIDWRARNMEKIARASSRVVQSAIRNVGALLTG